MRVPHESKQDKSSTLNISDAIKSEQLENTIDNISNKNVDEKTLKNGVNKLNNIIDQQDNKKNNVTRIETTPENESATTRIENNEHLTEERDQLIELFNKYKMYPLINPLGEKISKTSMYGLETNANNAQNQSLKLIYETLQEEIEKYDNYQNDEYNKPSLCIDPKYISDMQKIINLCDQLQIPDKSMASLIIDTLKIRPKAKDIDIIYHINESKGDGFKSKKETSTDNKKTSTSIDNNIQNKKNNSNTEQDELKNEEKKAKLTKHQDDLKKMNNKQD